MYVARATSTQGERYYVWDFLSTPSQSDVLDPFQEVLDCASPENKEMLITEVFNFDLLDTLHSKFERNFL